jgi:tRNA nucleotidyltransferase (CCA-adding enzyme)
MKEQKKFPQVVLDILRTLQSHGFESFLVGGAVRDLLLGKTPQDFDICSAAKPQQVKEMFPKVVETGLPFGTVTVLQGAYAVEVTTFRTENTGAGVSRRQSSVEEDVRLRDFTINGLLFDGEEFIDLVGGIKDLRAGKIKGIGRPHERYRADPLRMMRGIRLHCQLNFQIEAETLQAVLPHADLIQNVAPERIREELVKILISERPAAGFALLQQTGLLKHILPEMEACYGFDQRSPYHDQDVFHHTMRVLEGTPPDLVLRLAALFHDVGKPATFSLDQRGRGHFYGHEAKGQEITGKIMMRLKWDRKTRDQVMLLVGEHMHKISHQEKKALKSMLNRLGPENMNRLLDLQLADAQASLAPCNPEELHRIKHEIKRIQAAQEPISLKDLAIGGKDLIKIGFRPGREMGQVLGLLLEKVQEDPQINTPEELIKLAQGLIPLPMNSLKREL